MTIDIYFMEVSAPCRAALLTAKAVGVDINKKPLNLMEGEQLKPEYIAINPTHTVPTLVDGDLSLWESRAICAYLANQYGNESLYPKNPKIRAQVDKLLYFDMGTLYHRFGEYVYPVMFRGVAAPEKEKLDKLHEALGWFEGFLAGHKFAVGDNITIADHSLVASVSSFEAAGIDLSKYKNIVAWLARCKAEMPGYESENGKGATDFGAFAKTKATF